MNGLHSKQKLRQHYPQFDQNILRHIYKGVPPGFSKNLTAVKLMEQVDFDVFTNKTSISFKVLGLRASLSKLSHYKHRNKPIKVADT